ncbi:hypothetical protein BX070DRAFT_223540 [Coemansia spiralis]|nr:hypothetical protein BX070DRAFT_223540 [Coemansia spiralis]
MGGPMSLCIFMLLILDSPCLANTHCGSSLCCAQNSIGKISKKEIKERWSFWCLIYFIALLFIIRIAYLLHFAVNEGNAKGKRKRYTQLPQSWSIN